MKLWPPILASPTLLAQLDDISKDPSRCVSYSPFGPAIGTMFTKAPPVIKGMKGVKGMGVPAAIRAAYPGIARGLERAIGISKAHHETGTAMVVIRGRLRHVPAKAAAMARVAA